MQSQVRREKPAWRRSSKCDVGTCVEVHAELGEVTIRNSAYPTGVRIAFSFEVWRKFLSDVKSGLFDTIL
jgi:hypothetical protein